MNDSTQKTASCLCGRISISANPVRRNFTACHCDMCRKWGGLWMAVECSSDADLGGMDALTVYDSSAWAERGFCSKCGTHLFYKVKRESRYYIPVGLFGDVDDFVLRRQIYIDRKPDYYCFANDTIDLTEAQITAAAPPDE